MVDKIVGRPTMDNDVQKCDILSKSVNHYDDKSSNENEYLSSIFFQGLSVYCSCIYYKRIIDGFRYVRDNIEIIFEIVWNIVKCIIYIFLLALTMGAIFQAIGDKEKEMTLLKIMASVSFFDYIDGREGDDVNEDNEEENYRRWRRRRGYNN
tara:strand:+ start:129 stop:584 length:456 start_codon:yes stop_codon:yes gene_type:complete